jgi:hypothetical protein
VPRVSRYRVTVRSGPRVERLTAPTLGEALDLLEGRARAAAAGAGLAPIDLRVRRFEPGDQVAARIEIRGPERWRPSVRAGVDVRGDRSIEAWAGAPRREAVEARDGEDFAAALRRELAQSTSVEP